MSRGRLFQNPEAAIPATGNARSPTVESRESLAASMRTTTGDGGRWNRQKANVLGQIQWRQADEHGQLEIDALGRPQPVKVSKHRRDMHILRRSMYQSGSGVTESNTERLMPRNCRNTVKHLCCYAFKLSSLFFCDIFSDKVTKYLIIQISYTVVTFM